MTIGNAIHFLARIEKDEGFRKQLVLAEDETTRKEILTKEGLIFSPHEFEEAFNSLHVKCQVEEQAQLLKELKAWWVMVQNS